MKYTIIYAISGLIISTIVNASRGDFYGENDERYELFKILDDHVGTIKITLDDNEWAIMKNMTERERFTASSAEKYKVTNATLDFSIKGTDEYNAHLEPGQFYFQNGGSGSREFVKTGFNVKIEDGNLYDVKSLRIRPTYRDPTIMREKIASDILYKLDIPATNTGYINMEVNGEDLGIYIVTNKIKKDFMKKFFKDKNTSNLYECFPPFSKFENNTIVDQCVNTVDELADQKDEILAFAEAVNDATSMEDLDKVMDVDNVLLSIAFEFITLSWDHLLSMSHNYFWYKRKDGKWIYLLNDYDETFGQDMSSFIFFFYNNRTYVPDDKLLNVPNISIRDFENDHKFLKYLIYDDDTRFRKAIGKMVKNAFNPKLLFPRIDEIAELIRDDVASSRTIDEKTGLCKGCINTFGFNPEWTIEHFDECLIDANWRSNEEFPTVTYGLKFFIQERFNYICHTYGIDPDTLELIEPRPKVSFWGIKNKYEVAFNGTDFLTDQRVRFTYPNLDKEDYKQEAYNADPEKNNGPTDYAYAPHPYDLPTEETPIDEAPNDEAPNDEAPNDEIPSDICWSEELGYPCCTTSCRVYETDDDGQWGYENKHWCGIPSTCNTDLKCWSEKYGYPCCTSSCHIYETDEEGEWGYEDGHWCGITKENCPN
eukprot:jgi/Orpsp1_1/1179279/evm.model.c7180000068709.1